jgi:hemerythrin superfamily protein
MVTKTESTKNNESRAGNGSNRGSRSSSAGGSAFSWGGGNAGVLLGAAAAGAAVGLAANLGRKLFVQSLGAASGDWFDALKAEHESTLALFDTLLATRDDQGTTRSHLLAKIKYALTKHAHQEEAIVYPALRQANLAHDADALNAEHGYVKTYLYELDNMPKSSPEWIERVRAFRQLLEEHIRMEEEQVFPRLRAQLGEEGNAKLSMAVAREGMKLA